MKYGFGFIVATSAFLFLIAPYPGRAEDSFQYHRSYQKDEKLRYEFHAMLSRGGYLAEAVEGRTVHEVFRASPLPNEKVTWESFKTNPQAGKVTDHSQAIGSVTGFQLGLPSTDSPLYPKDTPAFMGDTLTDYGRFYQVMAPTQLSKIKKAGDRFVASTRTLQKWNHNGISGIACFEQSLQLMKLENGKAYLQHRLSPPKSCPELALPIGLMKGPVIAESPNNFGFLNKINGKTDAGWGRQEFITDLVVDIDSGIILSGHTEEVLWSKNRNHCDASLQKCAPALGNVPDSISETRRIIDLNKL